MDDKQKKALDELLSSRKYRDVCPETVKNAFQRQLTRHGKLKDADKAARALLHAITGAFISPDELTSAGKEIDAWLNGDEGALNRALSAHSSTRERMNSADEMYERVWKTIGVPETVLDIACGLNPVYLGAKGITDVAGVDINIGCVELVNACAAAKGWRTRARTEDVTAHPPEEARDLTLLMKLLPVLETQAAGAASALMNSIQGKYQLVTFPTKTLGGRGVGMERHYTEWFEKNMPDCFGVIDRFIAGSELVYLTERKR